MFTNINEDSSFHFSILFLSKNIEIHFEIRDFNFHKKDIKTNNAELAFICFLFFAISTNIYPNRVIISIELLRINSPVIMREN